MNKSHQWLDGWDGTGWEGWHGWAGIHQPNVNKPHRPVSHLGTILPATLSSCPPASIHAASFHPIIPIQGLVFLAGCLKGVGSICVGYCCLPIKSIFSTYFSIQFLIFRENHLFYIYTPSGFQLFKSISFNLGKIFQVKNPLNKTFVNLQWCKKITSHKRLDISENDYFLLEQPHL